MNNDQLFSSYCEFVCDEVKIHKFSILLTFSFVCVGS